jgi:predicted amino acid racemase
MAVAEPCLRIDLGKIEHNARSIVTLCARYGIDVTGVTKGSCGDPEVARAMLRGGVSSIGESRVANIERLRRSGIATRYVMLRIPSLSKADEIVAAVDVSMNSELAVVSALSAAAARRGTLHEVIVMVDLGDLREGVWPDRLAPLVSGISRLEGVRIVGIGTNLSCLSGIVPTEAHMQRLLACAAELEGLTGRRLTVVSGGASNLLPMIAEGRMPAGITNVRVGEAILLGRETIHRSALAGTFQDAFVLTAEVIEVKRKPSLPLGERGEDAFGRRPQAVDRGLTDRAIVNVGRADVDVDNLRTCDPRLAILGASSDQLLVDVTAASGAIRVGDTLSFVPGYGALLAAMISPYVEKRYAGY